MGEPDFGKYHHTTTSDSERIREKAKVLFMKTFDHLPFSRQDEIEILDIGCGLGFLSCVCAEYYPNAIITGIDKFEDASLKNSSGAKAKKNAEILGFSERITFRKEDILRANFNKGKFDLFVSNLVFHNLRGKRFDAYQIMAQWSGQRSYFVLGDLFFDYRKDLRVLKTLFGSVDGRTSPEMGGIYKVLVISKPKDREKGGQSDS